MGQGTFEIERRYLVRVADDGWEALAGGRSFRQGYVVAGDPSIRIRVGEARGPVLAFKAGKGVVRREVEALVPLDMAEALLEAAGGRVIRKTRYRLGPWVRGAPGGSDPPGDRVGGCRRPHPAPSHRYRYST